MRHIRDLTFYLRSDSSGWRCVGGLVVGIVGCATATLEPQRGGQEQHGRDYWFITPEEFRAYETIARAKGFLLVAASPLTRSSYHAGDDFGRMKAAREAQLAKA